MDTELTFVAEQVEMLRGMSRDDFLAQPCQVENMPPAEYRKTFGKPSDEKLRGLRDALREGRPEHIPVPAFEEEE
ncbi:hypothetical protein ACQEV4_40195 [Streptomyces shenzhenensis]|uniref:hypothetical protein n=1 Tax=Streptomyces shenzhenensis TaxID=943815 RepID=UPI003D8B8AA9